MQAALARCSMSRFQLAVSRSAEVAGGLSNALTSRYDVGPREDLPCAAVLAACRRPIRAFGPCRCHVAPASTRELTSLLVQSGAGGGSLSPLLHPSAGLSPSAARERLRPVGTRRCCVRRRRAASPRALMPTENTRDCTAPPPRRCRILARMERWPGWQGAGGWRSRGAVRCLGDEGCDRERERDAMSMAGTAGMMRWQWREDVATIHAAPACARGVSPRTRSGAACAAGHVCRSCRRSSSDAHAVRSVEWCHSTRGHASPCPSLGLCSLARSSHVRPYRGPPFAPLLALGPACLHCPPHHCLHGAPGAQASTGVTQKIAGVHARSKYFRCPHHAGARRPPPGMRRWTAQVPGRIVGTPARDYAKDIPRYL